MTHRIAMTAFLMIVILGASACQQREPVTTNGDVPEAEQATNEVYQSPGKPILVPVDVKYRLLDTPQVGQPVRIELTLVSSIATTGLGYTLQAEDGLTIDPAALNKTFVGKPALTPQTTVVSVTPQLEGRFYLRVAANIVAGGDSKTRIVTIPIQIGSGTRTTESLGEVKTDADGNPVVSLPAETDRE